MKNEHLIPPMVKDLCESLIAVTTRENERANYYKRVEAIKDICEKALARAEKINKAFVNK